MKKSIEYTIDKPCKHSTRYKPCDGAKGMPISLYVPHGFFGDETPTKTLKVTIKT